MWESDGDGFIQFYTNDQQYISPYGWSIWTWGTYTDETMSYVETQVKKISGDPYMGFGVIFR